MTSPTKLSILEEALENYNVIGYATMDRDGKSHPSLLLIIVTKVFIT